VVDIAAAAVVAVVVAIKVVDVVEVADAAHAGSRFRFKFSKISTPRGNLPAVARERAALRQVQ